MKVTFLKDTTLGGTTYKAGITAKVHSHAAGILISRGSAKEALPAKGPGPSANRATAPSETKKGETKK